MNDDLRSKSCMLYLKIVAKPLGLAYILHCVVIQILGTVAVHYFMRNLIDIIYVLESEY